MTSFDTMRAEAFTNLVTLYRRKFEPDTDDVAQHATECLWLLGFDAREYVDGDDVQAGLLSADARTLYRLAMAVRDFGQLGGGGS